MKKSHITTVRKAWGKQEVNAGGNIKWYDHFTELLGSFLKVKHTHTTGVSPSTPRCSLTRTEVKTQTERVHKVQSSFMCHSQILEANQTPTNNRLVDKQTVVYPYNGILLVSDRKRNNYHAAHEQILK